MKIRGKAAVSTAQAEQRFSAVQVQEWRISVAQSKDTGVVAKCGRAAL
jgi:hypothetical protein